MKTCIVNPNGVDFTISEDFCVRLKEKLYQAWVFNSQAQTWEKLTASASISNVLECIAKRAITSNSISHDKYTIEWRR